MPLHRGRVLVVDLTRGVCEPEALPEDWLRKYIGGKGLGLRLLHREVSPSAEPLGPDNVLLIMTGPFAGTAVPTSSRIVAVTRSPATGTYTDSYMGGTLAAGLKFAGFDGVVLRGRSPRPVILVVEDGAGRLEAADALWGRGTFAAEKAIQKRLGAGTTVVGIGPAGKAMVPFACLTSEMSRQAGRGGAGAVMGSKRLKAIAVRGMTPVPVADPRGFLRALAEARANTLAPANEWARSDGTPILVDVTDRMGILPTRNFQAGSFEGAGRINAERLRRRRLGQQACFSCTIACRKVVSSPAGARDAPEYETLGLGGSNCGIRDLDAVQAFNDLCDDLGLDTISTGSVVALGMELTERGVADYGVRFGEVRDYLGLVPEIAARRGRGEALAEGARALAARHGVPWALEVKGLELPAYDPRGNYGMGLAYATSDRGACHMRAFTVFHARPFDLDAMADEVIAGQNANSVKWSMILCDFWGKVPPALMASLLTPGLGEAVSEAELAAAGERIWNLGRLFNVRAGFRAAHDTLPRRILEEAHAEGPHGGRRLAPADLATMRRLYYQRRGWDADGVPTPETVRRLGLDV
jgi:aldehyde:ferredoxin oxidoreductase